MARLELACYQARTTELPRSSSLTQCIINPSLRLLEIPWQGLLPLLNSNRKRNREKIQPGNEQVLVWQEPKTGILRTHVATSHTLLALKLVAEGITSEVAARQSGQPVGVFDRVRYDAIWTGVLLAPESRLQRPPVITANAPDDRFSRADVFTLQWHLTQTCDLSCKHCYDRSLRAEFPYERAISLMGELRDFCQSRFVRPQISFSGGNPLLHPRFFDMYQAAADHGIITAILGNATDQKQIERILSIQPPAYYQVSLEGLEAHNDDIRGNGNFRRTVEFLRMLTSMRVPNLVMLTLTKANMDQVIPLARELEGITDGLTFNRLALFGEGARLALPTPDEYRAFLEQYVTALPNYPVLALKDSLLNTVFAEQDEDLFGGCAGFGCGAAFNFVAILSDGEVHACRKFPSPIGTIFHQSLEQVYESDQAARYRLGSSACHGCTLRAVCGGCPAVTASFGSDPFTERDPFCFRS